MVIAVLLLFGGAFVQAKKQAAKQTSCSASSCRSPGVDGHKYDCWAGAAGEKCTCKSGTASLTGNTTIRYGMTWFEYVCCGKGGSGEGENCGNAVDGETADHVFIAMMCMLLIAVFIPSVFCTYGITKNPHWCRQQFGGGNRPYAGPSILDCAVLGSPLQDGPACVGGCACVADEESAVWEDHADGGDKLMALRDREQAPTGMGIIELKDRMPGDSAEQMVSELYETLPDGPHRRLKMHASPNSDGRVVFVPEEDIPELQQIWRDRMQEARRNVERQLREAGTKRRAPRLFFISPSKNASMDGFSSTSEASDSRSASKEPD